MGAECSAFFLIGFVLFLKRLGGPILRRRGEGVVSRRHAGLMLGWRRVAGDNARWAGGGWLVG